MSERRSSGDWLARLARKATGWVISLVIGLVIAVSPLLILIGDLMIGPEFMTAYVAAHGFQLTGLALVTVYGFSAATTGLIYALGDRIRQGFRKATVVSVLLTVLAGLIALSDSTMDLGGITRIFYGEKAAANIWPENPSLAFKIIAVIAFLIFLCHELLLTPLLERPVGHTEGNLGLPGAILIRLGVASASWSMNISKAIMLPLGAIAMLLLDLVLLPQLAGDDAIAEAFIWGISLVLTGLNFMALEHAEAGGLKGLSHGQRAWVFASWGLRLADACMETVAYTSALYGHGQIVLIPEQPTAMWFLGAVNVFGISFLGEALFKELVWDRGVAARRSS